MKQSCYAVVGVRVCGTVQRLVRLMIGNVISVWNALCVHKWDKRMV